MILKVTLPLQTFLNVILNIASHNNKDMFKHQSEKVRELQYYIKDKKHNKVNIFYSPQ